ncbi:acyltransferase [Rickettsiella massiliensis]|uniref:acyltransferase n=1 Tax=Rickettsiella massiliensis TaxID=676517 RepID=UPI000527D44B|nr:acyltransferase [Rickettsiella massiliensis]
MSLLSHLRATVVAILYLVILILWFIPLALFGLFCYLIPIKCWQRMCKQIMERLPVYWIQTNYYLQQVTTPIEWQVTGLEKLSPHHWYLLVANHQSWTDILVLQRIFNHKIPPLKFFLKRELLWTLPFASWACWLLGFPFVHRPSKSTLAKHPERKNKDIEETKRACRRFRAIPTTVANFIEGTRFTEEKRVTQRSPYQHLLHPKAAGIAFSLTVLGDVFTTILDVTIVYPAEKKSLWEFLRGKIKKIVVHVQPIAITQEYRGDYQHDRSFRVRFQRKLDALWKEKDQRMSELQRMLHERS